MDHTSRTRLFRSLGNAASDAQGISNDVNQGFAGFRWGAPDRIDAVVLDSGAEVSVGRVVNAAGVSFL